METKDFAQTKIIKLNNIEYETKLVSNPVITCYVYIKDKDIMIFNPETDKLIKTSTYNTSGYQRFYIPTHFQFTKLRYLYVHQLVAMVKYPDFFNDSFDGLRFYLKDKQIDHINGDITDNSLDNIQLLEQQENLAKRRKNKKLEYFEFSNKEKLIKIKPEEFNDLYYDPESKQLLRFLKSSSKRFTASNKVKPKDKKDLYIILKPKNEKDKVYLLNNKNKKPTNLSLKKALREVQSSLLYNEAV